MSEFNSTITDRELRELFREKILADDGDDAFTDKLIDMEAKFVFAAPAMIPVPTGMEKEFLAKIGVKSSAKLAGKLGMKWIFTGLSCATITTAVVVYKNNQPKDPAPRPVVAAAAAVQNDNQLQDTILADTIQAPIPTDTPTDVTKQPLEQLSPLPEILSILPEANRTITEETVELVSLVKTFSTSSTFTSRLSIWRQFPAVPEAAETPNTYCRNVPLDYTEEDGETDDSVYNIDQTFSGVKSIEVHSDFGSINIQPSRSNDVQLTGRIEVMRKARKDPQFEISYEQTGTRLEVVVQQKGKQTDLSDESSVLDFEVPPGTNLILRADNGNINFNDLEGGNCDAESSFGDVRGSNCRSTISATALSGTVDLSKITGNVNATSSFGDVILSEITGNIAAHAASGNFIGNLFTGNCVIDSDFGDITVHNSVGTMRLTAESGNIYIDSLKAPECRIESSFGDVTLTSVTAPANLTVQSGDIKITALTGDLNLESAFGNVTVNNMTGELDLDVNSGNISVTRLNGNMEIVSSFGNVVINETRGNSIITANSGNVSGRNMDITSNIEVNVAFGNSNIQLKNNYNDLGFNLDTAYGKVKINKGDMKLEKENGAIVVEKGGVQVKASASSGNITFD